MVAKIKEIFNHQGFKKYFANTSWLLGEKILRMIVGLFIGIWVARYLGPDNFGLLSYAQAFVALFGSFATLGLNGIVVRELVKYPENEDKILGTAFILKFIAVLFTLLLIYLVTNIISEDKYTRSLIYIIACSMIFQTFNVINMYFQAKVISKYVVFASLFSLFLSSIIKIILIFIKAPLIAFVYLILFDNFIIAIGYLYWFYKINKIMFFKKIKFSFKIAKNLLKDSWPLIISGMVITIYMKIDQVMIKDMLDNDAVGNYSAAVRLSEAWYFIPMIITSSLFPAIINAKKISEDLYYNRLQKLYNLMVLMALAVALPVTFLGDWIIKFLYGPEFIQAADVLKIHIWAGVFVFLGVASSKWYITENLQKYSFYRALSGAVLNIVLNLVLIPKYNIIGAAIATLLSQFMASYLFNALNKKLWITFKLQTNSLLFRSFFKGKI